jgi:hypothetical protein
MWNLSENHAMTKRTLLVVLVAAALLIIGALAHGGRGDGALANWFQRIHGH